MSYGGVAIIFKDTCCNFKEVSLHNPNNYEVLIAAGSVQGQNRKVLVLACYIPPNYSASQANGCLNYIYEAVIELKRRYKDPYLVISGDFNQWNLDQALEEFRDITETAAGPTRGNRTIDRTFSNFTDVTESGLLEPLQTEGDNGPVRDSDHRISYLTANLPRKDKYRWLSYSYRYNNEESAEEFGKWIVTNEWKSVLEAEGSENKTQAYQNLIETAIREFFPLRTVKRRNIDPPWINDKVKRLIKIRKNIYKEDRGRTQRWKKMKKKVQELIDKRKKVFMDSQRLALLENDGGRNFFKNTKNYMSKERPKPFDVSEMFPGRSEREVAELLAAHFNAISSEFEPLAAGDLPSTYDQPVPILQTYEVAIRLKKFKKPKSVVRGDIFPEIVTKYADFLAIPLTSIYNSISTSYKWPTVWKEESVTVIPKCRTPSEIGQLRNISCTMLASKVYESYVLQWSLEQVKLKENQFGGAKGCSTSHLLISVWQKILSDLEDCRAATLLTAIDYAKAFNRMSFQECLKAFAQHGASNQVIGLVAAFLSGRTMSVRVGSTWSTKRPVNGGVPQGSILGVLLFNITTDCLEDTPTEHQITPTSPPAPHGYNRSQSTPIRTNHRTLESQEPDITPVRKHPSYVFLASARNVPRSLRDITPPPEPNPKTSAIWRPRPTSTHKFIDDGIIDSRLNMETVREDERGGVKTKDKHAVNTQNTFRRTVHNAEAIGMKVNTLKTNQICISDALSFRATAHIFTEGGEKIECSENLKVLGYTFGSKPTCAAHIETVRRGVRGRYWLLIHLGQHGFKEDELLRIYVSMIRPIAEYCAAVFHPMLTDREDEQLERLQSTALRYVYGYGLSYAEMREKSGLQTLRARRIELCDKFATKCIRSDRFRHWFPEHIPGRRSRQELKYKEEFARCDRLKNSPLFYMRRRMNGKPGKSYGRRNCQYRDT